MAKKSNKTEQVLKLITKNQELAEAAAEELDKEKEIKENNLEERTEDKSEEIIAQAFTGRSGSTILLNVTEKLVFEYVDEIMGKLKVCDCPTCKMML